MGREKSYSKSGHATLESMSQANWYNNWTTNIFKKYLSGDILEVGCGIGNFTHTLSKFGNVYAFDIDRTCVKKTKEKTKGKAKVGYGDIEKGKYFFKNKKFDTITCINVLEHIKDDNVALINITKLLKPGGTLVLLVPSHPSLYGAIDREIGHFRRYTEKDVRRMLKKLKLEVKLSRKMNLLGAIGWFISGKILNEVTVNANRLKLFNKIAPIILPIEKLIEPPLGTSILTVSKKRR